MRKILLATTALVAVAGVSAANAEISLSGGYDFTYTSVSDDQTDNTSLGENGTSIGSDIDLAAKYSTTTDTGLSISVSYDIDDDTGSVSIGGDFGTISFDDDNEAMGVGGGDADSVENMGIVGDNTIEYSGGEAINGGNIAYSTSFNGIEIGVGFGDGGTTTEDDGGGDADETSYGIAYSASVNGADVSISYAAASTGSEDDADASTDLNASSLAVGVTVGGISVDMARNAQKADRNDDNASATGADDLSSTNFGLSYAVSDSLTLQAASVAADGTHDGSTDYKYDESAYGIAYTIASGVTLYASYSDFTQSGGGGDDVSGSGTVINLDISF